MLRSLHVENIAVISSVDIDFSAGFNVLTGGTGAGKSIVIDSINLILGARADRDLIRTNESRAFVCALFSECDDAALSLCRDLGISCDERELIVSRELFSDGKSNAKINGRSVPLTILKEITSSLVTIHGQHDNQSLLRSETHISYLDAFAGCDAEKRDYFAAYTEYCECKKNLADAVTDDKERLRRMEMLEYQIKDIESAHLKSGEEESLSEMKVKVKNLDKINKNTAAVYHYLYENEKGISACSLIDRAEVSVRALGDMLPDSQTVLNKLEECKSIITDIAYSVDGLSVEVNGDPDTILTKIESRLAQIDKLERKYGADVESVLGYYAQIKSELNDLNNSDEIRAELEAKLEKAKSSVIFCGRKLSEKRKAAAVTMEKLICEQLEYLDMDKVKFITDFACAEEPGPDGLDRVEFLISANAGEITHPLAKIASGGELSRVMLAIKCVLAASDRIGTMIFDEVDTGISGKTSLKIGKKLRELSDNAQIVCVTHSAQIASLACEHFLISKREHGGRVFCSVESLDYEGRVAEISRIIGAEKITETVTATAKELLSLGSYGVSDD